MRLIDCFIPSLAFLRHFQAQPSGDIASVRQQLDTLVAEARKSAEEAGKSAADTQEALFAVLAWADEILLAAQWSGASEWARQLLQRRYFGISNAGNAFFSRLEQLTPQQVEVREVYFYCLSVGFAGRYGYDRNARALADIKQASLLQVLRSIRAQRDGAGFSPELEKLMFPEGYTKVSSSADSEKNAAQTGRWRWKFSALTLNALLIPLGVLFVLYAAYHIIIWQMVKSLMAQIR